MSQLDDFARDFFQKQNFILKQYLDGSNSLRADIHNLVRQLLLAQKGLSVIDQGDVITKCQSAFDLSDLTAFPFYNQNGYQVLSLDLKGAKKVRLFWNVYNDGDQSPQGQFASGIMGFFSTITNDTPKFSDFSFMGPMEICPAIDSSQNPSGLQFAGELDANLATTEDLVTGDGTIIGPIDASGLSATPTGSGSALPSAGWNFYSETECATAKFLYMIFPLKGGDGFGSSPVFPGPTYQLLG